MLIACLFVVDTSIAKDLFRLHSAFLVSYFYINFE